MSLKSALVQMTLSLFRSKLISCSVYKGTAGFCIKYKSAGPFKQNSFLTDVYQRKCGNSPDTLSRRNLQFSLVLLQMIPQIQEYWGQVCTRKNNYKKKLQKSLQMQQKPVLNHVISKQKQDYCIFCKVTDTMIHKYGNHVTFKMTPLIQSRFKST